MSTTLEGFLQRKGAVGLLSVLNERGKTYSEIESEVSITSDTISKRTEEATELGLVERQAARREHRTVTEYHLTDFGEAVAEKLAREGVVSNYLSMRTHQEKVKEKTEEVVEWLAENPNYFMHFEEAEKETLIDRTTADAGGAPSADGDRVVEMPNTGSTRAEGSTSDDTEMGTEADVNENEDSADDDESEAEGTADSEEGASEDGRVQKDLTEVDLEEVAEPKEGNTEPES